MVFVEYDIQHSSKKELIKRIKILEKEKNLLTEENKLLKQNIDNNTNFFLEELKQSVNKSEEEFKLIIESIPVSIVLSNIQGKIIYVNQTAIETFKLPKLSYQEYNTSDFYSDKEERKKLLAILEKDGFINNYEILLKTYNGASCWFVATIKPFLYQGQKTFLSVLININNFKNLTEEKIKLFQEHSQILSLFNLSIDLFCIANFDGNFLLLNPAWEKVLGYSIEELKTIPYLNLVAPEDQEKTIQEVEKLTRGKETIEFENRYRCKNGDYRWFLWTAYPVEKTNLIYCVVHDITKRKENEIKIRQSREQLSLITNSLPVAIAYINNERRYLFINQTHERWFNHKKEDVIGKYVWEILGQEFYEQKAEKYIDQVLKGEDVQFEIQINFPDQIKRNLEGYLVPDFEENREIKGYFCLLNDITERLKNEELLRIAETNYKNIFDNACDGIFQSTPEGKYVKINPALARIHGYSSSEEMINKITDITTEIFVQPEKREEFKTIITQKGIIKNFQYQAYTKDNLIIWLEENTRAVYDINGKIIYYEGIIQDITQRKKEEEKLKQEVQQLKIEIDQKKRRLEVETVTKTDYFQNLKSEIDKFRN